MASRLPPLTFTAHILGVLGCCLYIALALFVWGWFLSATVTIVLLVLLSFSLWRAVERQHRLASELIGQKLKGDFTSRLPENKGTKGQRQLAQMLNTLDARYLKNQKHKAVQERILTLALEELDLGVVILRSGVLFYNNRMAQPLLNLRKGESSSPYFFEVLERFRTQGGGKLMLDFRGETEYWKVEYRAFKNEQEYFELFTFKNQQYDTERAEEEISTRLMHVLTHEIMNSVSPINSLIDSMALRLKQVKEEKIEKSVLDDVQTSVEIIQRRSEGLMGFVKRYNLLAHLPKLQTEAIFIEDFTKDVHQLCKAGLEEEKIRFLTKVDHPKRAFRADRQLMTQVVLNLIKNAQEAFQDSAGIREEKRIVFNYTYRNGYHTLAIIDNAGGVSNEAEHDIFLPFFSTKDKASGIGLSLSRKIMQAHGGRLYLKNLTGGAEFRMEWPD